MANDLSAAVPLSVAASAPTRHAWHALELNALFPKEARQAVEAIEDFNKELLKLLQVTKKGLQLARALAALASTDPLEIALRAILKEIEALIDAILGETTAHALLVPIQKQYYGLGDPIPTSDVDPLSKTPNYNTLVGDNAFAQAVVKSNTPDVISFINTSENAQGGNQGYYNTIVVSLSDPGDFAKPDFPYNFAVAGVAVIFGSKSLTDIYRIVSIIGRMIDLGVRADLTARSQPVATDLKARVAPIPTEGRIGVILDWTPVPPLVVQPLLSIEAVIITEIIVIRSTDAAFRERFAWSNVFPTQPADDIHQYPSTPTTKVIARLRNDGFRSRYVDNDTSLKVSTPYYYALALRYKINGVFQPISELSNVVRVFYTQFPGSTRTSTPPDWFATPSLYQMFPVLRSLVSKIELFIESVLNRTASNNGVLSMIEQTIKLIESLIAQAEKWLADIKEITDILKELASANLGGIYTTNITISHGGIQGWTSELARRLSNKQDTSRPPFDESELTGGLVLVAGAPNFSELVNFAKLLRAFFGGDTPSPEAQATGSFVPDFFGTTPAKYVENLRYFEKDMTATTQPATTPAPAPPVTSISKTKPVFDTTMKPATKLDNC